MANLLFNQHYIKFEHQVYWTEKEGYKTSEISCFILVNCSSKCRLGIFVELSRELRQYSYHDNSVCWSMSGKSSTVRRWWKYLSHLNVLSYRWFQIKKIKTKTRSNISYPYQSKVRSTQDKGVCITASGNILVNGNIPFFKAIHGTLETIELFDT